MDRDMVLYVIAMAVLGVLALTLGFQPAYASSDFGVTAIETTLKDSGYIVTVTQLEGNNGYVVSAAGLADSQTIFLNALGATAAAMVMDGVDSDVSSVGVVTSEHTGFMYILTDTEARTVVDMYAKGDTFQMGVYALSAYDAATPMYF